MAAKINMLKLLQEMRGFSDLSRMHLTSKPPALFLMQLRDRIAESHRPKRRLTLQIDMKDDGMIPAPVTIKYLSTAPSNGQ